MSSFRVTVKHKDTGKMTEVWCLDDYFGRHRYGYVPNIEGGEALTEEEFNKQYEVQNEN